MSQGLRNQFWRLAMQVGLRPVYDCIAGFSETDFTEDLRTIDLPVLVAHGDDDQIVSLGTAAYRTVELLPEASLVVYAGAPRGLVW